MTHFRLSQFSSTNRKGSIKAFKITLKKFSNKRRATIYTLGVFTLMPTPIPFWEILFHERMRGAQRAVNSFSGMDLCIVCPRHVVWCLPCRSFHWRQFNSIRHRELQKQIVPSLACFVHLVRVSPFFLVRRVCNVARLMMLVHCH